MTIDWPSRQSAAAKSCKKAIALNYTIRVAKAMRVISIGSFHALCDDLWADADEFTVGMVPLEPFLPDSITKENFDRFPYLLSRPTIEPLHREDGSFDL